jgi:hypothetical protein
MNFIAVIDSITAEIEVIKEATSDSDKMDSLVMAKQHLDTTRILLSNEECNDLTKERSNE